MIDSMAFLLWVKGPMFDWAVAVFAFGLFVRIAEILVLGREPNYAEARGSEWASGIKTVFTRSIAQGGTFQRAPFNVIVGWLWHLGFIMVLLLFVPHVELIENLLGFAWPALPNPLIDAITAVTLVALVATLVHRLTHPVKKRISTAGDYLAWALTFLPVLTGYIAYHHLINPYPLALGLHILSAEIFLILLPFTKLSHIFTAIIARWYNGATFGRKGVES